MNLRCLSLTLAAIPRGQCGQLLLKSVTTAVLYAICAKVACWCRVDVVARGRETQRERVIYDLRHYKSVMPRTLAKVLDKMLSMIMLSHALTRLL